MRTSGIDIRWVFLIVLFLLLMSDLGRLPAELRIVLMVIGGGFLLSAGWQQLGARTLRSSSQPRVTYWRGERIEMAPSRPQVSLPPWPRLLGGALYLLLGLATIAIAVASLLRF